MIKGDGCGGGVRGWALSILPAPTARPRQKASQFTDQSPPPSSLAGLQQPQHRRNHQSPSRASRGGRLAAFELTCISPLRRLQQVGDADAGAMTASVGQTGAGEASSRTWAMLHFVCRAFREHGTSSVGANQPEAAYDMHDGDPSCPAAPGPSGQPAAPFPILSSNGQQGQGDGAAGRAGWIHSEGAAALLHPKAAPEALQQPLSWSVVAGDMEEEARRQDLTRSTWTIGLPRLEMPTSSARQHCTEVPRGPSSGPITSSPGHRDGLCQRSFWQAARPRLVIGRRPSTRPLSQDTTICRVDGGAERRKYLVQPGGVPISAWSANDNASLLPFSLRLPTA